MSYSYPIWNNVQSDAYKGRKSFGVKDFATQTVCIGTSAKNNYEFANIEIRRTDRPPMEDHSGEGTYFEILIDGVLVKSAIIPKGAPPTISWAVKPKSKP